ncbi:winged helix-turn-helix transcriptional regulator [Streptomyces adustus]|uniref:Winged helix-turn-helix transcriptional regulator n=1 Tax=Streptomyces adustus TaxID=1609272 RepID=A0A5N8VH57_9ACTN|nr:MarR family winged helix-turn-helix transcriptional regulator [Streptomyces adustus]MPY34176.1 winged helix-turn-helix transcriptional regulator [Streptomyces adustus]
MSDSAHEETIADVLRQLAAIAVIRRQLVRGLPQGMGVGGVVLAALAHCGEIRLRALADHLDCDLSVVSRQVAHLEQQGAVTRRANPDDRRSSLISITAQGRTRIDALVRVHTDLLDTATADWTPQELTALTGSLERLRRGLARRVHGAEVPAEADGSA